MARGKRSAQSPGLVSKVYVPILLDIFNARYRQGASTIIFSLDDIRNTADRLHLQTRNAADVVYRKRSRTLLPKEILDKGFFVLRSIGRGQYQFEKASSTIFEPAAGEIVDAIDLTPLPVRRLLPETMVEMDEQAALTIASYCKLFDHFTGLKIYRLRSHFRKSVPGIGQAELDAIDVGVAVSDDETPVVFPIEAKAAADALNRVQIFNMIQYCRNFLQGMVIRPLAMKIDHVSIIHVMEFNVAIRPSDLRVIKSVSYRLNVSDKQRQFIRATRRLPA